MKAVLAIAVAFTMVLLQVSFAAEIAIANNSPLAFGTFSSGTGGTVSVDTNGSCSAGGDVVIFEANCSPATFTVTGDPNLTYLIELPSDNSMTLSGPGGDMTITGLFSEPDGAAGLLGAGGSQDLSVGGTLIVGSGQPAGSYSGSFSVIVNYN